MTCAPVLMIGFNRPDRTRESLACVRRASPSRVYFAVDGARKDRPEERAVVESVRKIAEEVDWPCEVRTLFREENLGCARGVSEAISWFFAQEPYGIVLEDDIRPTEGFFRYETELLTRYKDDARVGMVSGFNHHGFQTNRADSYHFTTHSDIWGWGTWARVWKDYSLDVTDKLPRLEAILARFTDNRRMRHRLRSYISSVVRQMNTWDVQFSLMFAEKGYLAAAPRKRLTSNIGMGDVRGVHTAGYSFDAVYYDDVGSADDPLVHPTGISADRAAIRKTEARMCGILPRGLTFLGAKLPRLRPFLSSVGRLVEKMCPALFRI